MTNWPTIPVPNYQSSGSVWKPAIRSVSEAGYLQTRPRFTSAKEKGKLIWNALSDADFSTLKTYFITNQGGQVIGPTGTELEGKTCVFSTDELIYEYVSPGYKSVELDIEEV